MSDRELEPRADQGEGEAFRRRRFSDAVDRLYEPLTRYLGRRLSPQDAEEALDDVLLVIWQRLDDVPGDEIVPWAYGVARRVIANRRRSQRRRARLLARLTLEPPVVRPDPGESAEYADVAAAVARLAPREQEVLVLWAWEQLEPREIAVVLDTTANAVSSRLTRARRKLERELQKGARAPGHVWSGDTRRET